MKWRGRGLLPFSFPSCPPLSFTSPSITPYPPPYNQVLIGMGDWGGGTHQKYLCGYCATQWGSWLWNFQSSIGYWRQRQHIPTHPHLSTFPPHPPPTTTKSPTQDFGQIAVCVKYMILLPHTSVGDKLFQYYEAILQEHMPRLNKDLTT